MEQSEKDCYSRSTFVQQSICCLYSMANPASQASVATKIFPARKSLIGVGCMRSKDIEGFLFFFIVRPLIIVFAIGVFISGFFL